MGTARGGAWAPPLASFPAKPSSGADCWPKILGKWEFGAVLVRIPGFVALLSLSPHPPPSPSPFQHFPPALIPLIPRDGTPSTPNPIPELWKRWGPPFRPVPPSLAVREPQSHPRPLNLNSPPANPTQSRSFPLEKLRFLQIRLQLDGIAQIFPTGSFAFVPLEGKGGVGNAGPSLGPFPSLPERLWGSRGWE